MSVSVTVESADGERGTVDERGRLHVEQPDGSLVIRSAWRKKGADSRKHAANLAEDLSPLELGALGEDLIRGIEADDLSRQEYLETIGGSIDMLGLRMDEPKAGDDSGAPLEGMATMRHPMLLKACLRFQADFVAEMLPADGPVKVRNDSTPSPDDPNLPPNNHNGGPTSDDLAQAMQTDFNHFLTATATEYYPDTTRMAFRVGLTGCAFKKGYHHPIWRRPAIESVESNDLIVSNAASDLQTALRVTHRIKLHNAEVRRMVRAGVYRDVPLGQPMPTLDAVEQAEERSAGVSSISALPADYPHTIWECYTDLDLPGFEDKDGNYLPYKVSIDKDSRQILEIRRDWRENDKLKKRGRTFVKYPYVDALWFYSIGLMHILGNTTRALTAAYREFLDSGMFSNFPGFLYAKAAGRQLSNQFRVPPGGGMEMDTGGAPIRDVVMDLPYKSLDAAFLQFIQHLEQQGEALGGSAEIPTNEGRANMPVGTMLAMIEQAVKPVQGVFKGLHRAQAEEFQMLRELFLEDPGALWRFNEQPARDWEEQEFLAALSDARLVPAADPNTQSQVQRVIKAYALLELAKAAPWLFRERDVALRLIRMFGISDPDSVLASIQEIDAAKQAMAAGQQKGMPPNPQLDAARAADAQAGAGLKVAQAHKTLAEAQTLGADIQDNAAERQARAAELLVQSRDRAADRQSHLEIAELHATSEQQGRGLELAKTGAAQLGKVAEGQQDRAHEAVQGHQDRLHEADQAERGRSHEAAMAAQAAQRQAAQTGAQRAHETQIAGMQPLPKDNKK